MKLSMAFYLHMVQPDEDSPIFINMYIETDPDGTKYINRPSTWTIETTSIRHESIGFHYKIGDRILTLPHPRIYIKYFIDSLGKDWESEVEIKLNPYYLLETKEGLNFVPSKKTANEFKKTNEKAKLSDFNASNNYGILKQSGYHERFKRKPFVEISEKIKEL